MADQPVTREKLINADIDVDNLGKAVNEETIVTPRYGDQYKSAPLAIKEIEDNGVAAVAALNAKADQVVAQGFYKGYTTEALLLAAKPAVAEMRARADDTRKIYRWNRTSSEGVTPITGTWVDTGLSDKDLAAVDATTKANTAKNEAIVAASTDATTKANTAKAEAIAAASSDATAKANAAEANSKTYTNEVVFSGLTENIYETPIDPPAPVTNGVSATAIYAEPALYSGLISKAYGRLADSVTSFKAKVFEIVDDSFVLVSSSNIPVVIGATEHALNTPLNIKSGQYIGFYCVGGMPRATQKLSKPYKSASGDASSAAASNYTTTITWQMYFANDVSSINNRLSSVENGVTNTADQTKILKDVLIGADKSFGAPVLSGGSTLASIIYVPYAKPMDDSGYLKRAEFNLSAPDSVGFFVARKLTDTTYQIVFETSYIEYAAGINLIAFEDEILIKKGDLLGWKALARKVVFDTSVQAADDGYYSATKSGNILTVTQKLSNSQPRVKFIISPLQSPLQVVLLTQAQYDALDVKDLNTMYGVF